MAFILGAVLVMTLSMVLLAVFILWLSNRTTHLAITARFREAEFILEHHRAPANWAKPRGAFAWMMQRAGPIRWRDAVSRPEARVSSDEERTKARVLARMDELIKFFETSPFFEDETARETLLSELGDERAAWAQQPPSEIIADASLAS